MKKYLFTSPLRHWKNGDKKTAVVVYLTNIVLFNVSYMVTKRLIERAYKEDKFLVESLELS